MGASGTLAADGSPSVTLPAERQGRPTQLLPLAHLLRISAYWLGLTAIDACVSYVQQNRVQYGGLADPLTVGRALAFVSIGGSIVAILIQPTVGYLSDFTVSRWGRRKPYILAGSLLDVVFLLGIAASNTLLSLAAFSILLALSTNVARGPFQGYVPDLVAERQVGLASAMVGLMQTIGNVVGYLLAALAAIYHHVELALVAVAIVELLTMLSVVVRVGNGLPPRDREGRSWPRIAREAWSTDILAERSFVWLLASRLAYLMGGAMMVNEVLVYLGEVHGLNETDAGGVYIVLLAVVAVTNVLAVIPAGRASDRIGRKPIIYTSCAIAGAGTAIVAFAPSIPVALVGGGLFGAGAGMFLAVDWALMTDIIPRASAGRYMGLSNVATGSATPLGVVVSGLIIDGVNNLAGGVGPGPRVAFIAGSSLYLVAALLLRRVREPGRTGEPIASAAA